MDEHTTCPRCGARDSFMKGFLPETCVCRICQSQLDWREIPGCGPDCSPRVHEPQAGANDAAPADASKAPAPEGGGTGEGSQSVAEPAEE